MNRRNFLIATGSTTTAISLAGCFQDGDIEQIESTERPVKGDPDAPVTMEYYFNINCGACQLFHTQIQPTLDEDYIEQGVLKVEYYNITNTTNRNAADPLHSGAYAVLENVGLEAFFEYVDQAYTEDANVSQAIEIGIGLGVDETTMKDAVQLNQYKPLLDQDIEDAQNKGITATPTLIVNGNAVSNPLDESVVTSAIDDALENSE